MREIKFRAWDIINNRPLNLFKFLFAITGEVMAVADMDGTAYGLHQIDLRQFTGLRDKSGKEIYGGDILRREERWTTDGRLSSVEVNIVVVDWAYLLEGGLTRHDAYEVIGNIYENPELMEEAHV